MILFNHLRIHFWYYVCSILIEMLHCFVGKNWIYLRGIFHLSIVFSRQNIFYRIDSWKDRGRFLRGKQRRDFETTHCILLQENIYSICSKYLFLIFIRGVQNICGICNIYWIFATACEPIFIIVLSIHFRTLTIKLEWNNITCLRLFEIGDCLLGKIPQKCHVLFECSLIILYLNTMLFWPGPHLY